MWNALTEILCMICILYVCKVTYHKFFVFVQWWGSTCNLKETAREEKKERENFEEICMCVREREGGGVERKRERERER